MWPRETRNIDPLVLDALKVADIRRASNGPAYWGVGCLTVCGRLLSLVHEIAPNWRVKESIAYTTDRH